MTKTENIKERIGEPGDKIIIIIISKASDLKWIFLSTKC